MINKFPLLICLVCMFIGCETEYGRIYGKTSLSLDDCKNVPFIRWLFQKETNIQIQDNFRIIVTDYEGGIPLWTNDFPIYYELNLNVDQYNKIIAEIIKNDTDWLMSAQKNVVFNKSNKFELACKIDKSKILFGFRNVTLITP